MGVSVEGVEYPSVKIAPIKKSDQNYLDSYLENYLDRLKGKKYIMIVKNARA